MPNKIMPYILPIATILIISSLFIFARPAITGFFVAQPMQFMNTEIRITANEVLPQDAILYISLERDEAVKDILSLSIKDFVNRYEDAQDFLEYQEGKNSQLGYEGPGYVGSYILEIQDLGVDDLEEGIYTLNTKVIWQGRVVSETKQELKI